MRTVAQIVIKKHNALFKSVCRESMEGALKRIAELRARRDSGAAYNYQEDKANAQYSLFTDFPCGPDVLVNTKILERTLKFIKQLLANEVGPLNDLAKDGLIPGDLRSAPQHASVTKIYSEKTWQ